jgi:serine/threonine protein kinase
MQSALISEMTIMRMIDHSCIVKLYAAMQDAKYVYFLLELLPGRQRYVLMFIIEF